MKLIKNKDGWRRVRLDEVVIKREENDRENARNRFDQFVAGEHLDPESLHIRRVGSQRNEELPPSFYKIFRKGQILFMTRRPYLRKNALAHFDGICGEKMLTLQVREEVADPNLIPFLFHSERFYDHTTGCMIGSTNPHCRWRDIAKYEFLLPPKGQQAKLAKILWAADDVVERLTSARELALTVYQSKLTELLSKGAGWNTAKVGEIAAVNASVLPAGTDPDLAFSYLDIASIIGPKRIGNLERIEFGSAPSRARRVVSDQSIVLSLVRPYLMAFAYVEKGEGVIASTGTAVIDVNPDISSRLVFHQFFSNRFRRFCNLRMTGTSYPAITAKDVMAFKVFRPFAVSCGKWLGSGLM